MYLKKVKKIILIPAISIIIFALTFVFPIKFCRETLPIESKNDFYVIRHNDLLNAWLLVGDKNGLYDENSVPEYIVYIEGKNPKEKVSGDLFLWDRRTYFIIYGTAKIEETFYDANSSETIVDRRYTINSTGWDILGSIDSRNRDNFKFSMKYLNIYDYKWFDHFRRLFGAYSEY